MLKCHAACQPSWITNTNNSIFTLLLRVYSNIVYVCDKMLLKSVIIGFFLFVLFFLYNWKRVLFLTDIIDRSVFDGWFVFFEMVIPEPKIRNDCQMQSLPKFASKCSPGFDLLKQFSNLFEI